MCVKNFLLSHVTSFTYCEMDLCCLHVLVELVHEFIHESEDGWFLLPAQFGHQGPLTRPQDHV